MRSLLTAPGDARPRLHELAAGARAELSALGEVGLPLVEALDLLVAAAGDCGVEELDSPVFALSVLTDQPTADPAVIGRLLSYLRSRSGSVAAAPRPIRPLLADALAAYEANSLSLMAKGTGHTYRTWTKRLAAAYPDADPATVTAGDLQDLIAGHVAAARRGDGRGRRGAAGADNAVTAFRHVWAYFAQKRWVTANVALELRKPPRGETDRRAFRPDEAALVLALTRVGRDPLLDLVTVLLGERAGMRRIEVCRLRVVDCDLEADLLRIWGKNDKPRDVPITPGLRQVLVAYLEDRRPAGVSPEEWARSEATLLRSRPSARHPQGMPHTRRRIEDMWDRFKTLAPGLLASGELQFHSYRHTLGKWMDVTYGRGHARAALGHTPKSPTDYYTKVSPEEMREPMAAYEEWLLAAGAREDEDDDDAEPAWTRGGPEQPPVGRETPRRVGP